jgi:hypothetical protein
MLGGRIFTCRANLRRRQRRRLFRYQSTETRLDSTCWRIRRRPQQRNRNDATKGDCLGELGLLVSVVIVTARCCARSGSSYDLGRRKPADDRNARNAQKAAGHRRQVSFYFKDAKWRLMVRVGREARAEPERRVLSPVAMILSIRGHRCADTQPFCFTAGTRAASAALVVSDYAASCDCSPASAASPSRIAAAACTTAAIRTAA